VIWGSPISLSSFKKPRYSREPRGLTYFDKTTIIPYGKNVCRNQDAKINIKSSSTKYFYSKNQEKTNLIQEKT
jgi:hypothetical protein